VRLRTRLALSVVVAALPVVAALAWTRARFEQRTLDEAMRDYVLARMENGGRELCESSPETFPEPPAGRRPPPPWERDERRFEAMRRALTGEGPPDGPGGPLFGPEGRRRPDDVPGGRPPRAEDGGRRPPRAEDEFGSRPPRPAPTPLPRGLLGAVPPRIELWAYDASFVSANPRAPEFPTALRRQLESGSEHATAVWVRESEDGLLFGQRTPWETGPCAFMLARRHDRGPVGAVSDLVLAALALCAVVLGAVFFAAGPIVERVRRLTSGVQQSAAGRYAEPVAETGQDEITELAQAFNVAGREVRANIEMVEKRERALRAFVENTTHDVMLPLTVLQGHLTSVRRRVESGQVPDAELVRDALEESHYLTSLLQNLAVAARLEGADLPLARHPLDLNALVERAVARQRPIATQKNVALDYAVPETPAWTEGDVTFVEQMLSNVIHNAVRYNKEHGHVAVILESLPDERFALRVLDDGPGIPAELRSKVVERSYRTDAARSRHPDGMGLGLSIAKDVAERHAFEFHMRDSSAGGLEIEFRGPRCAPRLPPPR